MATKEKGSNKQALHKHDGCHYDYSIMLTTCVITLSRQQSHGNNPTQLNWIQRQKAGTLEKRAFTHIYPLVEMIASRKLLWSLVAGLCLLASPLSGQDPVELHFIDVGQGDAILIQTPDRRAVLVDAGPNQARVTKTLTQQGINTLTLTVATHPHADHIGGMDEVLKTIRVENYMDNGTPHTTQTYQNVLKALQQSTARRLQAEPRRLRLGKLTLRVLPLPPETENLNNRSVVLLGSYGEFDFLLPGDAETEQIHYLLEQVELPEVEVLKASHHGSRNGLTPAWLQTLSPQVVVVPVGADNRYGHPHESAIRYYQTIAQQVFRNDHHGNIRIRGFQDGRFQVRRQKEGHPTKPAQPQTSPQTGPRTPHNDSSLPVQFQIHADAPGRDHQNLNGEYLILTLRKEQSQDLSGYQLCDEAQHCFKLPEGTRLEPDRKLYIYMGMGTNQPHEIYLRASRAVWNNGGDTAYLYNPQGEIVAQHTYGAQ